MIRARPTRPKQPKGTRPHADPPPEPEDCDQSPPCVLPEPLVRSVMLRLEHAVRWANWPMVLRICRDAALSYKGLADDTLRPIEQRPIEQLNTLAGLSNQLVYALRAVRGPGGPLATVQDVLDQGQLALASQPGMTWQRVERVWAAIEHSRTVIERDAATLLCWQITPK